MENLTKMLVHHLVSTRFEDLPRPVVHTAKRHILDTLGCMLFGQTSVPGRLAVSLAKEQGENPNATIVGELKKTSYMLAALANGTMGHSWELDDRHLPSNTHTSSCVVSTALSSGERTHGSGRLFLASVILGQDVAGRIGFSVRDSHRAGGGFHGSGTVNTFGAAAVAGKMFGLDEDRFGHALGLAGTQAMGMTLCAYHNHGKPFHCGKAAMAGLLSALLAEKGFTGGLKVLEGDGSSKGYLDLTCPTPKPERILAELGQRYEYERAMLKPYSCAGDMHTGIDSILALKHRHNIKPEEITAIHVVGFEMLPTHFDVPSPKTSTQALLSYQHCLAVALIHDEVMPQYFVPERLADERYQVIRSKFTLASDPKFGIGSLEKGAMVEVVTARGTFSETVLHSKGELENPLTDDEVSKKFVTLATSILPHARAKKIVDTVFNMETLDDIRDLTKMLRPTK